ncbi:MAG TPA: DUF86 domain-containing protein [Thermoplasmata archaeon]|nr:DUF86 domain-containing protein [Thermoplasmata archaeon]
MNKERILAKVDELEGYLKELRTVTPERFEEYVGSIEKRRGCERLLHIAIECAIDICGLIVTRLRLGIPADERDLFKKLSEAEIISEGMASKLSKMRAFRNILVHRYGAVDDELVFKVLKKNLGDFKKFKREILDSLQRI